MKEIFDELIARYPALADCRGTIEEACQTLCRCFEAGGKLLLCGNGGSAADCEHIAGELLKGFRLRRPLSEELKQAFARCGAPEGLAERLQGALPALSLCGHSALSTAFLNDVDPYCVFAQQVMGFGRAGDVLLAISTSGNSRNVLSAAVTAKALGLAVIGLTGASGGELKALCDVTITVPETETYKVQEYHLPVYHAICEAVERRFFEQ